ncbi:MAG: nucleotidyltransferase family protein [Chloroflexota bacterium]
MITATILAAGLSHRMGKPKMALPWAGTTVLGRVLLVVRAAGVEDLLVVTGAAREAVEAICLGAGVRTVPNPDYESGEMLSSLQIALRNLPPASRAALVVLGDQPSIQESVVDAVIRSHTESGASLVVPSYQRRRGHPWLVGREWWAEILEMQPTETPRDFLNRHSSAIHYVQTGSASILQDIDTPEEYLKSRP